MPLPDGPVTTWKRPAPNATLVGGRPSIEVEPDAVPSRCPFEDDGLLAISGPDRRRQRRRGLRQRRRQPALPVADLHRGRPGRADALGDRATVGDVDDTVGHAFDELVVGHDDAGRALGADQVAQHIQDRLGGRRVELARRLVGEQQRRARRERDGERDALLLAARELVAEGVATSREPDPLQQLLDAPLSIRQRARLGGRGAEPIASATRR